VETNYQEYLKDPSEENLKTLEDSEDKLASTKEYTTGSEFGELQHEYLKALDFLDMLTEDLRFYNVCRAKTGPGHTNCGLAYPAKMWKKADGWKFYCSCEWDVLVAEAAKHPQQELPSQHLVPADDQQLWYRSHQLAKDWVWG